MEAGGGKKSPDSPISRFTAVNSFNDQKASLGSILSPDDSISGNDGSDRRNEEKCCSQKKPSHNHGNENLVAQTMNPLENRVTASTNCEEVTSRPSLLHFVPETSRKRRRSSLISNNPYHIAKAPDTSAGQKPPTSPAGLDFAQEECLPSHRNVDSRDNFPSDIQYRQYLSPNENHGLIHATGAWSNTRQPHPQRSLTLGEQIGRVLQIESHNINAKTIQQEITKQSSENNQTQNIKPQPEVKKRKRNFSNRTKTGCMTCRRRKKKCDETRPKCNNCVRGGFTCTGYQTHDSSPKAGKKAVSLSLQSKKERENSLYASADSISSISIAGFQPRRSLPGYCDPALKADSRHDQILGGEGHEPILCNYSTAQIPSLAIAPSSSYLGQHIQCLHERKKPTQNSSRQESGVSDDPEKSVSATPSSSLPQLLHSHEHGTTTLSNPQKAAQLALSTITSVSRPCLSDEKFQTERPTQKEKMLAGQLYYPLDKELVQDRKRCKVACWRFNNSVNPNLGVSPDERARLFRDIVYPRHVGDGFVVEAPFSCDYGYNISIGSDVQIGKNCTILDVCEVKIGNRCHIGPNVDIYTASLPIEPKIRLGTNGPQFGKKVTIKDDCWICGRVLILPGLTIGEGSVVGAGSVVTKDVPPYTLVRGSPAHVLRAISRNESKLDLSMELGR